MSSAKFAPLNQSDDYRLDDVPHGPPQYTDPAIYHQHVYQQQSHQHQGAQVSPPPAWQNATYPKLDYPPNVTYVSTPIDQHNDFTPSSLSPGDKRRSSRLSFLGVNNPVSNLKIPTFAAPWQHEAVDTPLASSRTGTVRNFDRKKQWWRLFANGFLQWLMTAAIVAVICVTLWGFEQLKPMSRWQRYTFNALMTLFSLCISLSIVSALRSYAKLLRWRFLATEYRDLQDFELIMNCESQSKILKLLWAGRTPGKWGINKTQVLCALSLGLVIGLQVVIALMGLTYSIESTGLYLDHKKGLVSLADLSGFRGSMESENSTYLVQAGAANYYSSIGSRYGDYFGQAGTDLWRDNDNYTSFYTIGIEGETGWEPTYFYQFYEQAASNSSLTLGGTIRYVRSEASCTQLNITAGGTIYDSSVDYYDEHGINRTQEIWDTATYSTTYMTDTSEAGCGPRCSRILILDTGSDPYLEDPFVPDVLWSCNSTLGQVVNTKTCTNETNCIISDEVARMAAGAIGLSGVNRTGEVFQTQLYTPSSMFSYSYWDYSWMQDPANRASLLAYSTAAVIAAMDATGERIVVPGMEPSTGMVLDVEWNLTIPVLAIVPGVQLIVLIIVCVWANGAMVKDGSYLATARLLLPIVEKLEHHGCALTGDEIARELGNFRVIYGARAPRGRSSSSAYMPAAQPNVDWHAGVIFESEGFGQKAAEGWLPGRVWPTGRYDGDEEQDCHRCCSSRQRRGIQPVVEESEEDEFEDFTDEKSHLL